MTDERKIELLEKILREIRDEIHTLKRHSLPMFVEREMPLVDALLADLDADDAIHRVEKKEN